MRKEAIINIKTNDIILDIKKLSVKFHTRQGTLAAVRSVNLQLRRGRTLAIVGESGSGKSISMQAIMGLLGNSNHYSLGGSACFNNTNLLNLSQSQLNKIRGRQISMIFQNPMSCLNPTMKVGKQIAETLCVHQGLSSRQAQRQAIELLAKTHIPEAAKRAQQYPFEFSGGMLQRVMIAMALACRPQILIADEPTTALDATIQDQILNLLQEEQRSQGTAIILITHDLGVVARMADDVAIMYAGQIVEAGDVEALFYQPAHPYNLGLKDSAPQVNRATDAAEPAMLKTLTGAPPNLLINHTGCAFAPRCKFAMQICKTQEPEAFTVATMAKTKVVVNNEAIEHNSPHLARCWLQHPESPKVQGKLMQTARQSNHA